MYRHTLLSTALVCLLTAPAWGQTYNPTASDPITLNTAGGTGAPPSNGGIENTGFGYNALANTTGEINTALGGFALGSNTTGNQNTASGYTALAKNTTGSYNTAHGLEALGFNTTGDANTASGIFALSFNTTGILNTASGSEALTLNTTGSRNTGLGSQTLYFNTTGSRNIAIGSDAGSSLRSGSNNLYLSHQGVASESNTMRLGHSTHTSAFIAGVAGRPVSSGRHVMINSAGQLGVLASSARYKNDIQPMGAQSQKLQQLRPVTFSYKEDTTATRQYGLIAEEVAKVYPELVIRNDNGTIEGVHYEALAPLLLNQVQQQEVALVKQDSMNVQLLKKVEQQQTELAELRTRLDRMEAGAQTAKR